MTNAKVGFWTEDEAHTLAVQLLNGNTVLIAIDEDVKDQLENAGIKEIDPL